MPRIKENHPAIQAIQKSVASEQWIKLAVGLFFAAIGILGLVWTWGHLVITILMLVMIGGALLFLKSTVDDWNKEQTAFMDLLTKQPQKIVWVYTIITQRMPFGLEWSKSGTIYFKLINGEELTVTMPAKHITFVSRSLNKLLPHATFGFTKDREQWYMASPEMLLKDK